MDDKQIYYTDDEFCTLINNLYNTVKEATKTVDDVYNAIRSLKILDFKSDYQKDSMELLEKLTMQIHDNYINYNIKQRMLNESHEYYDMLNKQHEKIVR